MKKSDKKMIEEWKELEKSDIHKMTVKEFAEASEHNPMWQSSIWTKAYKMEKEVEDKQKLLKKTYLYLQERGTGHEYDIMKKLKTATNKGE